MSVRSKHGTAGIACTALTACTAGTLARQQSSDCYTVSSSGASTSCKTSRSAADSCRQTGASQRAKAKFKLYIQRVIIAQRSLQACLARPTLHYACRITCCYPKQGAEHLSKFGSKHAKQACLEAAQHDLLLHIVHTHILAAASSQQEGPVSTEGQGGEALP